MVSHPRFSREQEINKTWGGLKQNNVDAVPQTNYTHYWSCYLLLKAPHAIVFSFRITMNFEHTQK